MGALAGIRIRLNAYGARVVTALHDSFSEEYSAKQIARSFAIGVFITMLPTLGAGLLVFVVLAALVSWINKVALFASVVVFNPVVKWGVYAASMTLGVLLLGPPEGSLDPGAVSLNSGSDVLIRLLVGNLILAVIATVVGYIVVYRMVVAYREREATVVDDFFDSLAGEFEPSAELAGSAGDDGAAAGGANGSEVAPADAGGIEPGADRSQRTESTSTDR